LSSFIHIFDSIRIERRIIRKKTFAALTILSIGLSNSLLAMASETDKGRELNQLELKNSSNFEVTITSPEYADENGCPAEDDGIIVFYISRFMIKSIAGEDINNSIIIKNKEYENT